MKYHHKEVHFSTVFIATLPSLAFTMTLNADTVVSDFSSHGLYGKGNLDEGKGKGKGKVIDREIIAFTLSTFFSRF